jgi:amidohydrolase
VDAIFALHVGALAGRDLPAGTLTVLPNAVSAGKDKFTITIHGKSTHSAFPALGIDPIRVAARIVVACEELMKKENANGTAVLSFGSVTAGEDHNTIPASALLKGSIRCQDEEHRSFLGKSLQEISEQIARSYGATCTVNLVKGSSTVVNDERLALLAAGAIEEVLGKEGLQTQTRTALMGSDDFANYLKKVKGVYFFLHTNNLEKGIEAFNHNAKFDIDEEVLYRGVAATVAIAEKYLGGKGNEE